MSVELKYTQESTCPGWAARTKFSTMAMFFTRVPKLSSKCRLTQPHKSTRQGSVRWAKTFLTVSASVRSQSWRL